MGRPVSQHLGGGAAAAVAAAAVPVDVLTVATVAVGLVQSPIDDGAGGAGPPVVLHDSGDRDLLWPDVDDGGAGCGETDDECLRAAEEGGGGGLEEDDDDVCGGGGNRDCGCANAFWKKKIPI